MESKIQKYAEKWCEDNNGRILKPVSEVDELKAKADMFDELVAGLETDWTRVPMGEKQKLIGRAKELTDNE